MQLLIDAGRLVEANILLDWHLSQALDGRDRERRSAILTSRAVMAWRLRRIPLALELAAEGWTDLDSEPLETPSTAQALGNLGYLLYGIGHRSAAIGLLRQSVQLAREAGSARAVSPRRAPWPASRSWRPSGSKTRPCCACSPNVWPVSARRSTTRSAR